MVGGPGGEMAGLVATHKPCEIREAGEYQLRDRLNEFGAGVVEAALNERVKKGGLSGS